VADHDRVVGYSGIQACDDRPKAMELRLERILIALAVHNESCIDAKPIARSVIPPVLHEEGWEVVPVYV
jgi:hypothetical protein